MSAHSEYNRRYYLAHREELLAKKTAHAHANSEQIKKHKRTFLTKQPHYHYQYARKRYEDFIVVVNKIKKEKGCIDCGFRDPRALDFDHVGPKRFNIANGSKRSMKDVLAEIAQCVVRCANCHRIKTVERRLDKILATC